MKNRKTLFIRFIVLTLILSLFASFAVTSSAYEKGVKLDTELSSDKKTLTATIILENAVGVAGADLRLAFDSDIMTYESYKQLCPSDIQIAAGQSVDVDNLITCSFMLLDSIPASMVDADGSLQIISCTFKLKNPDKFDKAKVNEYFFLYADSIGDADETNYDVAGVGNDKLIDEKDTGLVLVKSPINSSSSKSSGDSRKKIVIAIVIIFAAAVIVAVIINVRKGNIEENGEKNTDEKNTEKNNSESVKSDDKKPENEDGAEKVENTGKTGDGGKGES